MSLKQSPSRSEEQSIGCDPTTTSNNKPNQNTKRNSGLFAFFKWLKSPTSRESVNKSSSSSSSSCSSCDSLNSIHSAGTVASFAFVPPNAYNAPVAEKCIQVGPETDTYKARLKERDKLREKDKNVTLRKKYNLFFNRDSLLFQRSSRRISTLLVDEENTKSLPLITHTSAGMEEEEKVNKVHRRANSESSKIQRAGAYLHVKGKRRAPQPPDNGRSKSLDGGFNTLRRNKKRVAPAPPSKAIKENVEDATSAAAAVLCNDSLKLDNGILKPAKELSLLKSPSENSIVVANNVSPRSSCYNIDTPVSPRPWYKRNSRENVSNNNNNYKKCDKDNKYEPVLVERLPDVQFTRKSTLDLTLEDAVPAKKEDKRKSGLAFLTNISELDREASEILKSNKENGLNLTELRQTNQTDIPEFMRPKEVNNMDSWASPKRRSARDLIAKFNAITNVTKVSVFGGSSQNKDKFFGKQQSLDESRQRQESMLETHKKRIEEIDKKKEDRFSPLMKSESANAVKKPETPKIERKSWKCPKCHLENEYWRIICHVCSAIKPYFDDFAPSTSTNNTNNSASKDVNKITSDIKLTKTSSPLLVVRKDMPTNSILETTKMFERSKTQIGFSALATYNANKNKKLEKNLSSEQIGGGNKIESKEDSVKKDERERLKKMLIEMKNSLPKRKSNIMLKQTTSNNNRASIIVENPTEDTGGTNLSEEKSEANEDIYKKDEVVKNEKSQEEKVAEILIGTTTTIYENIKMKKTDNPKPIKVSSSAQTSAVVKKTVPPTTFQSLLENNTNIDNVNDRSKNYEPMKLKDFENIYTGDNKNSPARIYANLAQNDELSLFFNVPKNISELKNNTKGVTNNTDTIEINRLLRRLETAIAKGDLTEAAIFAKELAQLRVSCSVIRQKSQLGDGYRAGGGSKNKGFQIEMYVEDKVSHRGPFPIEVTETQTVADLKKQIENEFEIPVNVQRWILGKELVTDDKATLKDHKIKEGCAVFLYLVAPDKASLSASSSTRIPTIADYTKQNVQKIPSSVITKNQQIINTGEATSSKIEKEKPANLENKSNASPPTNIKNNSKTILSEKEAAKLKITTTSEPTIITTKVKNITEDHTPKIVNVIPKLLENNKQKSEIVRIIPIQLENKPKPSEVSVTYLEKPVANQRAVVHEKPTVILNNSSSSNSNKPNVQDNVLTTTEIKIEVKQGSSDHESRKNVVSAIPINISSAKTTSSKLSSSVPGSNLNNKSEVSSVSISTPGPSTSTNADVAKIFKDPKATTSQPPKAKVEEDFLVEDYDTKTLKPSKEKVAPIEWECHLCTLLNPVTSNVCAVCATVRVIRVEKAVAVPVRKSTKKRAPQPNQATKNSNQDQTYLQLVNLDSADLVENLEPFECVVCFMEIPPREGVTLRECLHQFCKACLAHTIEYTEDAEIKCPYRDDDYSCDIALQDREIKTLVSPVVYEQYLARSVAQAENKMDKSFHCKTPDCRGWCIFEDNVNEFRCPVCRQTNCLTCQAIHTGVNCRQYQERMKEESEIDEDAKRTRDMLDEMVEKGEALTCPTCKVVLMKKWGCDWLRCSMCKTEICWVTRGPRWGPAGKGDTTGGCQCGVNGVKCHPKCNYCH